METQKQFRFSTGLPLLVFFLFLAAILVAGMFYYSFQKKRLVTKEHVELSAIADLKVGEIVEWREERMGDARLLSNSTSLARQAENFIHNPENQANRRDITRLLQSLVDNDHYSTIVLFDTSGKAKLACPQGDSVTSPIIVNQVKESTRLNKIIFTDLHRSVAGYIHLDLLVPLTLAGKKDRLVVSTLLLRVDPYKLLFPLIQSWPTPSKTSETLLIRAEGDSVVFLNELRHRQHTALLLQFPLSDSTLPASMAAHGIEGIVEGIDYRGVPVLASIKRIPGSLWIMIAKVDQKEIFAPLRRQLLMVSIFIAVLISLAAALIGLWVKTLRHRSLSELYEAEIKKQAIMQHFDFLTKFANDSILLLDRNRCILELNDRAVEAYGYTRDESIGLPVERLMAPETFGEITVFHAKVRQEGRLLFETVHRRKNGDLFPVEVSSRYFEAEGRHFYQSIIRDITERKQAETLLQESEKKLREAQEMAHLGFWEWDIMTGNVKWSKEVYKIFHLDPQSFVPNIDSILALSPWPEDQHRDKELIRLAIESHNPGSYEQKFLRPDESTGYYYSTFQGKYDEHDSLILIVGTVLDITERKQAEEAIQILNLELEKRVVQRTSELETANKELETFSYSVSHDLRSPLRAISGFTRILSADYEGLLDAEGKRLCKVIVSSANRMGQLIDDLLSFSRVGRSEFRDAIIDMEELVHLTYDELTFGLNTKKILFTIHQLLPCSGDSNLIRQVWTNLLSNALKYSSTREHPEISVGSEQNEEETIYYVKDNGVGFEMEYAHKLFGVFQRLHSSAEFEGTGVGLAIVQRIVQRHRGRVWAEGEVGKGATFYFTFPIKPE